MTYRMGLLMPDRFAAANAVRRAARVPDLGAARTAAAAGRLRRRRADQQHRRQRAEPAVRDQQRRRRRAGAGGRARSSRRRRSATRATRTSSTSIPSSDHFALILADEWGHTRDFLDQHPARNLSPDEVRYKRYPSMDLPQHGLRFDGAYWVDGMTVRTPGGRVRARDGGVRVGLGPGGGVHARARPRALDDRRRSRPRSRGRRSRRRCRARTGCPAARSPIRTGSRRSSPTCGRWRSRLARMGFDPSVAADART